MNDTNRWRPVHETIIDAIIRTSQEHELIKLTHLVKETWFPKNHDDIITAWNIAWLTFIKRDDDTGVVESLLEQKQVAVEREALKVVVSAVQTLSKQSIRGDNLPADDGPEDN